MPEARFMQRCFQLACYGAGNVSPNPLVGAVLVYKGKIIGEGWHKRWGGAHAEVNCLDSVLPENQSLIPYSTLYCNLEPCAHFGKTPPCTDLILGHKVSSVVVSNLDPNPLVSGKGLEKLKRGGIETSIGLLEKEGAWLNRAFFTWIAKARPYIILKWAQSADGYLGEINQRTTISSQAALRLVHRWRADCDAIIVGTNTAILDNPRLDNRYFYGKKPLRVVLDTQAKIPFSHNLLDDSTETWVYRQEPESKNSENRRHFVHTQFINARKRVLISDILENLKRNNCAILLVEGGANLLDQFIQTGNWDEIRVLENIMVLRQGLASPVIPSEAILMEQFQLGEDCVHIFARQSSTMHADN
ncbi:MAG: bifunctional diaminohydroxyphosphoribosylaminopyrimidine deaminase/5-amino-6-(5-phosphoribosylamino)uracil reductase RibD [Saprospiraceae bacterium]